VIDAVPMGKPSFVTREALNFMIGRTIRSHHTSMTGFLFWTVSQLHFYYLIPPCH
jgi:hypothetical protein